MLNNILIDVSPAYTGNIDIDSTEIANTVYSSLNFGKTFLKKGGNLVCKMLESDS